MGKQARLFSLRIIFRKLPNTTGVIPKQTSLRKSRASFALFNAILGFEKKNKHLMRIQLIKIGSLNRTHL